MASEGYRFCFSTSQPPDLTAPAALAGFFVASVLVAAASGTADTPVSQQLSGLEPGTTYHYRLVAMSEAGTSYGADETVTPSANIS